MSLCFSFFLVTMEDGSPIWLGSDKRLSKKDLYRALFCSVAVYKDNAGAGQFLTELQKGYPSITFDKVHMSVDLPKGQKYLVGYSGGSVFIAFRGTKSKSDVAHDLRVESHAFSGGKFHTGFFKRASLFANSDRNPLPNLLQGGKRIIFCGHSLGGAVAHVVLFRFWIDRLELPRRDEYPDSMISLAFGAPHVCDEKAAWYINNNENLKWRFINFVNQSDPVPRMLHFLSRTVSAALAGSFYAENTALQSIGGFAGLIIDGDGMRQGLVDSASRITVNVTQRILSSLRDVVDFYYDPQLSDFSEVCQESDFHPIGKYIHLTRGEGGDWRADPYFSGGWKMRKFTDGELVISKANMEQHRSRNYVPAVIAVFPIDDSSIRPIGDEVPDVVVTTPSPKVTLAKWVDVDPNQRHIIVEGENLLFLRDSVYVACNRERAWKIKTQSDNVLMIYDPSNRERSQESCSSDDPQACVTIRTAFGHANHFVQKEYPSNISNSEICRLISKLVQTLIVAATPTVNNSHHPPQAGALVDRLDNITHCVPALNGKKVSATLAQISRCNDISARELENHCSDINYMIEAVVKYLTSSFKLVHYNYGDLQERASSLLLPSKVLSTAACVGMAFLPLDPVIGGVLLVISTAGILLLRPKETIIESYNLVLSSAILETSEWSASNNTNFDRNRSYSTSDLERILYEQVRSCSREFKGMVDDAHSRSMENVSSFKSKAFKNATPESKLKLLKRIKLVYEIKSLHDQVAGTHYIGILGAEGAGKSTFIKKVLQRYGPPYEHMPETDSDTHSDSHTHTRIVRSYKVNNSLCLVDYPGSDGSEHYADMWKQYTALSSSAILFLNFEYDIKREQIEMYQKVKENLGVETEVAVVFNKVDKKINPRVRQRCPREYFQRQRKENETKLECNGDNIYFSCVDPDYPEELTVLKRIHGVFGLEELVDQLVIPKSRVAMNPAGI